MKLNLATSILGAVLSLALFGCASQENELQQVAKDWCMTIRASQVLPVYPLSEDVRPGDVFIVPTTLREQARIYREKGFLPLDQIVTRLNEIDEGYERFYSHPFAGLSQGESTEAPDELRLQRVAFPSYSFEVDKSKGFKLALPIQGVPAGLGIMGASKAQGTVTIRDAFTYGVDTETMNTKLQEWWAEQSGIRPVLSQIPLQVDQPVYLRVVTRVYLTSGVTVALSNLSSGGAGVDAGVSPELELINLSTEDPEAVEAAANAYQLALKSLQGDLASAKPGGSLRLLQASSRSVTMSEDFDRPLVIGYRGFDVRIQRDGTLSVPIPSFATLRGDEEAKRLGAARAHARVLDDSGTALDVWIDEDEDNYNRLRSWLEADGTKAGAAPSVTDLIYGVDTKPLRLDAIKRFKITVEEQDTTVESMGNWIDDDDKNYDRLKAWLLEQQEADPDLSSVSAPDLASDADQKALRLKAIKDLGIPVTSGGN